MVAVTDTNTNPLNAQYIELAARFKACWTVHRFQEGLQKFFGQHDLGATKLNLQSLYKRLRGAGAALDGAGAITAAGALHAELDAIKGVLAEALAELEAKDARVAPSTVRRFFQKVDSYDERILIEMVRFYQEVQRGRTWSADRIDKVDFLVSALARMIAGADLAGDRRRLDRVLDSLAGNAAGVASEQGKVRNRLQLIGLVRDAVDSIGTFAELDEKRLVEQYRTLKHSLGDAFFDRAVLGRIIETNVAVGKLVVRVTRWEEERIFADYERLSDIESSGVEDRELLKAVTQIRADVGTFRRKVETGSIRIAEVVRLRDSLGSIDASLKARDDEDQSRPAGEGEEAADGQRSESFEITASLESGAMEREPIDEESPPAPPVLAGAQTAEILRGRSDEVITPWLEELLTALASVDRGSAVEEAVCSAPLGGFDLEPREVVAYRRLVVGGGAIHRERFLLSAAAVRVALERAERGARPGEASAPAPAARGRVLDLADRYLRDFGHYLENAGRESPREAEALLRCRVRLMRAFSGVWLRERVEREAQRAQAAGPGAS